MIRPTLPDGLVVFVKRDCATCVLVEPVLADLRGRGRKLTVYTQDDPTFPDSVESVDDTSLELSWHHDIETVPTVIVVDDGHETTRTVGWDREQWEALVGEDELGTDLPDWRPGCGSLSVDPDLATGLEVRFGGSVLRSRRVEIAGAEDDWEALHDRGWSDGLPVVPPTEERVLRMLQGTTRRPDEVMATVPPDLADCTVEKIAVNAVLAGCRPEYLPVVIAAVEAACTDEFNMHGLLATTMPTAPVLIVNGPIRNRIGMNAGINVLGQGNRANSTIGRALQLVIRNVGGGRPGEVDRATQGNPAKLGFCFPEDEEGSPWESLAVERGFSPEADTVTLFPGEGPRCVVDQLSRDPHDLTRSLAMNLRATTHPKLAMAFDAILVISPEHAARYRDAGWSKARFREELDQYLLMDADDMIRGAQGVAEGVPVDFAGSRIPKFRPDGLHIVHAGSGAGLFSMIIGGWVNGEVGSNCVTKEIPT
ncbi:MAG: thioredoxin family protein [Acidimicrobiia bacterium]|nr:thioredoxin family protein [Acidimicrobiia bacterium]